MWKHSKKMMILAVLVFVLVALYKIGNSSGVEKKPKQTQSIRFKNSKRVEHLNKVCNSYNLNETNLLETLDFRKVLINRKYKFLYCNIPKVSLIQYSTRKLWHLITFNVTFQGRMLTLASCVVGTTRVKKSNSKRNLCQRIVSITDAQSKKKKTQEKISVSENNRTAF